MEKGIFTFLGTGSSSGVPVIACGCAVCQSLDPRNQRLRCSALLQVGGKNYLIDAGPDFRTQSLRFHITRVDGLLLTHAHFDHIAGLDDLRTLSFRQQHPIPVLASHATAEEIKRRFDYLFRAKNTQHVLKIDLQTLSGASGWVNFSGLDLQYMTYLQGNMPVTGYRIGKLAYLTDIKDYPPSIFDQLQGLEVLVVSALKYAPSHIHFTMEEAVVFAKKVGADHTYFTHISHEVDAQKIEQAIPSNVALGYDGLQLEFSV